MASYLPEVWGRPSYPHRRRWAWWHRRLCRTCRVADAALADMFAALVRQAQAAKEADVLLMTDLAAIDKAHAWIDAQEQRQRG